MVERSDRIQYRIEQQRKLGKEEDARLEAQRLRSEIVWQNAALTKFMIDKLMLFPEMTHDEFQEEVSRAEGRGDISIVHPYAVDDFMERLVSQRDRVSQIVTTLKEEGKNAKVGVGKAIYLDLAGLDSVTQKQEVRMKPGAIEFENTPIAPIITVPEKLFDRIDPRTNVGGFYNENGLTREQKMGDSDFSETESTTCPVIVIKNSVASSSSSIQFFVNGSIRDHEIQHGENDLFSQVQLSSKKKVTWAKNSVSLDRAKRAYLIYTTNPKYFQPDIDKEDDTYKQMIHNYAHQTVKDELLAALVGGQIQTYDVLLDEDDNYNYFLNHLNCDKEDPKYQELWREYIEFLKPRYKLLQRLDTAYRYFDLDEKREQLPWVLAQFPIEDWIEEDPDKMSQLDLIGITEELELLENIMDRGKQYYVDMVTEEDMDADIYWDQFGAAVQEEGKFIHRVQRALGEKDDSMSLIPRLQELIAELE